MAELGWFGMTRAAVQSGSTFLSCDIDGWLRASFAQSAFLELGACFARAVATVTLSTACAGIMARRVPTLSDIFRGHSGRDDNEGDAGRSGRGVRLVERADVGKRDGSEDQDSVRDLSLIHC